MPVNLSQDLERTIRDKVKSGQYQDAAEVVRKALHLLEEHDQSLASAIQPASNQVRVPAALNELEIAVYHLRASLEPVSELADFEDLRQEADEVAKSRMKSLDDLAIVLKSTSKLTNGRTVDAVENTSDDIAELAKQIQADLKSLSSKCDALLLSTADDTAEIVLSRFGKLRRASSQLAERLWHATKAETSARFAKWIVKTTVNGFIAAMLLMSHLLNGGALDQTNVDPELLNPKVRQEIERDAGNILRGLDPFQARLDAERGEAAVEKFLSSLDQDSAQTEDHGHSGKTSQTRD